jgi:hypothetical protein
MFKGIFFLNNCLIFEVNLLTPYQQDMKKIVALLVLSVFSGFLYSQDTREFKFTGTITDKTDGKPVSDYMVDVFKGNDIIQSLPSGKKGVFKVILTGGSSYVLEITKEGYYPKRAIAITNVPEDLKKLPEFKFEMELIRTSEYESLNNMDPFATSIFDFPYVIFEYDMKISDLNFRKEYTDHIKDQYQAVDDLR